MHMDNTNSRRGRAKEVHQTPFKVSHSRDIMVNMDNNSNMDHNMDNNNNIMEGIIRGAFGIGKEHIDTYLAQLWNKGQGCRNCSIIGLQ